jgi:hypothetical protein
MVCAVDVVVIPAALARNNQKVQQMVRDHDVREAALLRWADQQSVVQTCTVEGLGLHKAISRVHQ